MDFDKKQIESLILKEIEKTKLRIEEYKEATKPISPENSIGRLTRMDAINNKSVMEAGLRQSREKLLQLEHVMSKIDDEHFGKCKKCGAEIPIKRILLMPQSLHCVSCAQ